MNSKFTISDLKKNIDELNKKYKLSDKSICKIVVQGAYGGWRIVLKSNLDGRAICLTNAFLTPKETMFDLMMLDNSEIKSEIKRANKIWK